MFITLYLNTFSSILTLTGCEDARCRSNSNPYPVSSKRRWRNSQTTVHVTIMVTRMETAPMIMVMHTKLLRKVLSKMLRYSVHSRSFSLSFFARSLFLNLLFQLEQLLIVFFSKLRFAFLIFLPCNIFRWHLTSSFSILFSAYNKKVFTNDGIPYEKDLPRLRIKLFKIKMPLYPYFPLHSLRNVFTSDNSQLIPSLISALYVLSAVNFV